jgi:hypothetical protein
LRQSAALVFASESENLPAAQSVQTEAPAAEYVPATQLVQFSAPASECVPASQSLQECFFGGVPHSTAHVTTHGRQAS